MHPDTTTEPSEARTAQAAPWRDAFLDDIKAMESPDFVFSSLVLVSNKNGNMSFEPRARYCSYCGLWSELPDRKDNHATRNPRAYESDLPVFTTDVRSQKLLEISTSGTTGVEQRDHVGGSGGGGPCEAVWWVKTKGIQWRVKGTAFVVGPDIETEGVPRVQMVRAEVGSRMRVVDENQAGSWSWDREITTHFGNIPPVLRASFKNPPPNHNANMPHGEDDSALEQEIHDLHEPAARQNFRVVIIKPNEVESIDLSNPAVVKRVVYKFDEKSGCWSDNNC